MKQWRLQLQSRWQSLTPVQRLLATCIALLIVFATWDLGLMGPMDQLQRELRDQQSNLQLQLHEITVTSLVKTESTSNNPLILANQRAARLNEEITRIDSAIDDKLRHFIKPEQFADILQQMLVNSRNLSLLSLITKIPQPLNPPLLEKENRRSVDLFQQSLAAKLIEQQRAIEGGEIDTPLLSGTGRELNVIYRYPIELTFTGDFFNTLSHLKSLETMPWRPVWETLNYKVTQYPHAQVTLHIYTLSRG